MFESQIATEISHLQARMAALRSKYEQFCAKELALALQSAHRALDQALDTAEAAFAAKEQAIFEHALLDAVKTYALHYFDDYGKGVYVCHLEEQGLKPNSWADWNITPDSRVIHTIHSMEIDTYDPENGAWYVTVHAEPEVPDVQTFEVFERDGTFQVSWHGC